MQGKRTILGTATPGGGFPLYGGVFAEALNAADPATGLRVIAAMYSSPGMFVVRADSPVRVIADLKGQTVAFGAKGSGLTILGRTVIDGRVAALWGAGIGWPGFTAVASSAQGARFIVPDAAEITRSLAMIGITAASNRPAELRVHVQGALANGCTPEQIREVLLLVTMYCGIPAGNDAHRVAYEVIEENAGRKAP